MPNPLTPEKLEWPESEAPAGQRAGQAHRNAIIPWFDKTWGGSGQDSASEERAGFAELPLLVALAILGAGSPHPRSWARWCCKCCCSRPSAGGPSAQGLSAA